MEGPVNNSTLVFVVIGDYGLSSGICEEQVSVLVSAIDKQFGPLDFIITTGKDSNLSNTDLIR